MDTAIGACDGVSDGILVLKGTSSPPLLKRGPRHTSLGAFVSRGGLVSSGALVSTGDVVPNPWLILPVPVPPKDSLDGWSCGSEVGVRMSTAIAGALLGWALVLSVGAKESSGAVVSKGGVVSGDSVPGSLPLVVFLLVSPLFSLSWSIVGEFFSSGFFVLPPLLLKPLLCSFGVRLGLVVGPSESMLLSVGETVGTGLFAAGTFPFLWELDLSVPALGRFE